MTWGWPWGIKQWLLIFTVSFLAGLQISQKMVLSNASACPIICKVQNKRTVFLPNFAKKPWSMFSEYFWPVKNISIDWLDPWFYFIQRARDQVNQSKEFSLVKNIHKTWIKVFFAKFDKHTGTFMQSIRVGKPYLILILTSVCHCKKLCRTQSLVLTGGWSQVGLECKLVGLHL